MFCDEEKYDFVIYRLFFLISFYESMKLIINIITNNENIKRTINKR